MDIFQTNTVMTDIPKDAVTPAHRAILRIMSYDLRDQDESSPGTIYISSSDPISDLDVAMDIADGDEDEDLISTSSLGIDAKIGKYVGICEVLQSILQEPAATGLDRIKIQGAFWAMRPVRGYIGGWAACIERDRIRIFDSSTVFDEQGDQPPATTEEDSVHE